MDICKKNKKKIEFTEEEWLGQGEQWAYTCVKRKSYFFLAFEVGKLIQETCDKMLRQAAQRIITPTSENRLTIFSDGNDQYVCALRRIFAIDTVNYGQLIKIRENSKIVDKIRRIIYGIPKIEDIETTNVENFNSIIRERLGRYVRKTKCHAKKLTRLRDALSLFQFYWNFIKPLHQGRTPAMEESLINRPILWSEFLHMQLSDTI